MRQCNQEENLQSCPCTYPGCDKKGICCLCLRHHLSQGELPACCFPADIEKTYDRSIEKFIKVRQEK